MRIVEPYSDLQGLELAARLPGHNVMQSVQWGMCSRELWFYLNRNVGLSDL